MQYMWYSRESAITKQIKNLRGRSRLSTPQGIPMSYSILSYDINTTTLNVGRHCSTNARRSKPPCETEYDIFAVRRSGLPTASFPTGSLTSVCIGYLGRKGAPCSFPLTLDSEFGSTFPEGALVLDLAMQSLLRIYDHVREMGDSLRKWRDSMRSAFISFIKQSGKQWADPCWQRLVSPSQPLRRPSLRLCVSL